jgi:glyoxylase-like metal-dependent hydrolase (beta-lactamase superfamily II)
MKKSDQITVVKVGYRSTFYWVISAGRSRLLFDLGWPGLFGALLARLKQMDIPLKELKYGLASHYHIDHAGCAQELKNRGIRLIVTPEQVHAIPLMKQWIKPTDNYLDLDQEGNTLVTIEDSRAFLEKLGIGGQIVHTPGHSDDSVSLLLDNGAAFTGDLTPLGRACEEHVDICAQSWQKLRHLGAKTVYPAHSPPHPIYSPS